MNGFMDEFKNQVEEKINENIKKNNGYKIDLSLDRVEFNLFDIIYSFSSVPTLSGSCYIFYGFDYKKRVTKNILVEFECVPLSFMSEFIATNFDHFCSQLPIRIFNSIVGDSNLMIDSNGFEIEKINAHGGYEIETMYRDTYRTMDGVLRFI